MGSQTRHAQQLEPFTFTGPRINLDSRGNHRSSFPRPRTRDHDENGFPPINRGTFTIVACQPDDGVHKETYGVVDNFERKNGNGVADGFPADTGNGVDRISFAGSKRGSKLDGNEEQCDRPTEKQDNSPLDQLRGVLQTALEDLERARVNSAKVEEEAQLIAERAFALQDEATEAERKAEHAVAMVNKIASEESGAEELLLKARALLAEAQEHVKQAEHAFLEAQRRLKDEQMSPERSDHGDSESRSTEEGSSELPSETTEASSASLEKVYSEGAVENSLESICVPLKEEQELNAAEAELKARELALAQCEADLLRIQGAKLELQNEALRLGEGAKRARAVAASADEDVANAMSLAEQAVALEVEAAQRVSDAEIALQKTEKLAVEAAQAAATLLTTEVVETFTYVEEEVEQEKISALATNIKVSSAESSGRRENGDTVAFDARDKVVPAFEQGVELEQKLASTPFGAEETSDDVEKKGKELFHDTSKVEDVQETEVEKKVAHQQKKSEPLKDAPPAGISKPSTKRSSRFFSASYFSFEDDGAEFTPGTVFQGVVSGVKQHFLKLAVGLLLLGGGSIYCKGSIERQAKLVQRTEFLTSIEEVTTSAKPLIRELQNLPRRIQRLLEQIPHSQVNEEETSLFDVLWLLLASVIFVPTFQKLPGGSPVLGYLAAGVLIGPYSLSIIRHVHGTKAIAEFGVVFLLFNIGLELSVERLSSMKKYVFGLGTAQVFATAFVIGVFSHYIFGFSGPAALVVGNGLALSSTAVVLQVLQERGESTSRHGRATFSVLLFQDLAVVVLLILIPLLSPNSSKGGVGFHAIAEALGIAAVKAVVAITGIIAGGRLLLRPIYKRMAENHNAEIFSANTLFVVLGTSVLTARAGLSMALGAFLAGLLLAETEFALQVESDIAPYRGLLLGLFFMTVGMSIDPKLFIAKFPLIVGALSLLLLGKTFLVASMGRIFGLSTVAGVRAGLLLAPGGEFAFVAFGEAVNQRIMTPHMSSLLFLVVGLSMALTPWLGALGQFIASRFEQQDVRSLLPAENETDDLQDHIIVCGFGRVGQIIAQLLSERLIPFVALDVRSERVSAGRALDLPVYFGDAGSKEVLHKVGAERASCAVITLDTPGANYRTVWALSKNFPNVKTFVRAHDVDHGINLEKAGATAVVPETLEPSLQLAAAVLAQAKLPASEIAATVDEFRSRHLSELRELSELSGTSLGYGFSRIMGKPKLQSEAPVKGKVDDDMGSEMQQEEALVVP